jgi:hypothetical protein
VVFQFAVAALLVVGVLVVGVLVVGVLVVGRTEGSDHDVNVAAAHVDYGYLRTLGIKLNAEFRRPHRHRGRGG